MNPTLDEKLMIALGPVFTSQWHSKKGESHLVMGRAVMVQKKIAWAQTADHEFTQKQCFVLEVEGSVDEREAEVGLLPHQVLMTKFEVKQFWEVGDGESKR